MSYLLKKKQKQNKKIIILIWIATVHKIIIIKVNPVSTFKIYFDNTKG